MSSYLQFSNSYTGLFFSRIPQSEGVLSLLPPRKGLSCWIYTSPELAIAVVIGEQHAEPVQAWLHDAHDHIEGSSVLAGILSGSARAPASSEVYLFYDRQAPNESALLRAVSGNPSVFCAVAPNLICAIAPSAEGLALFREHPDLPSPLTGLICKSQSELPDGKHSTEAYDPLKAQIREVLNSSSVALLEQLKTLGSAWRNLIGETPPKELNEIERAIDQEVRELRESVKQLQTRQARQPQVLAMVSLLNTMIQRLSATSHQMISQATQYRRPGNPLTENATYSDAIAPFFLRAAKNLTAELANRCGISTKNVIPVISDEFTFHDDPFHFDEWMKFTHIRGVKGLSTPSPRVALACIPIQFRLRLGALPVLAHEIAHFIGHTELEQKLAKGKYKSDSLTATLDELDFSVGTDLAAKALQYEAKQAWMQELIADCVAVLIMGPAYLYAFARFATGTLGEPDNKFSSTHPGFVKRLRCCLAFLKSMNFDVPFQSQFFTVGKETIGIRLARDLTSLVKRPYTADDHLNATGNVKRALQKGAVPDAPPTLILNALWDAVVRKELYVNEIASLFAIYR